MTIKINSELPKFKSKAFFAPMAGVSDPALRLVCKELGAGLVVTEFISIHAVVARNSLLKKQQKQINDFIEFSEKERPLSIQLFGCDLEKLKQAVKIVEPFFDIIDYNMGCPAPHINSQMAGAALLQHKELTEKIFKTLVENSKKPITLKMRAGVTKPDLYLDIAKLAEKCGVKMITLHPRTVKQGYSGKSDWSLIRNLKESVNIPVVGNGDIITPEDAKQMLDETGCNYVMIGRGACKNPFLFTQINQFLSTGRYDEISDKERINYFIKYLDYSKNYNIKFSNIRMQGMNFTKGITGGKEFRLNLIKVKNIKELRDLFEEFKINL